MRSALLAREMCTRARKGILREGRAGGGELRPPGREWREWDGAPSVPPDLLPISEPLVKTVSHFFTVQRGVRGVLRAVPGGREGAAAEDTGTPLPGTVCRCPNFRLLPGQVPTASH